MVRVAEPSRGHSPTSWREGGLVVSTRSGRLAALLEAGREAGSWSVPICFWEQDHWRLELGAARNAGGRAPGTGSRVITQADRHRRQLPTRPWASLWLCVAQPEQWLQGCLPRTPGDQGWEASRTLPAQLRAQSEEAAPPAWDCGAMGGPDAGWRTVVGTSGAGKVLGSCLALGEWLHASPTHGWRREWREGREAVS